MRNAGFTIIELMTGITVAAVLIAVATPGLQALTQNSRLRAVALEAAGDLALARSEAVRRGGNVTLCASTDGTSCNGASWADGRIVRAGGQVLATSPAAGRGVCASTPVGGGFPGTNALSTRTVTFDSMGRLSASAGAQGALLYCIAGRQPRVVWIGRAGHASITLDQSTCPPC